jgi:hypothetical protein
MTRLPPTVTHLFGALCAWSATVFLGAVLLDVAYAGLLKNVDESLVRPVYGEVSDFLLSLGGFSFLAALTATAVSWDFPSARNLFAASSLLLASEFLAPIVLFPLLRASPDSSLAGVGPYVRVVPLALASLLALGAFRASFRDSLPRSP